MLISSTSTTLLCEPALVIGESGSLWQRQEGHRAGGALWNLIGGSLAAVDYGVELVDETSYPYLHSTVDIEKSDTKTRKTFQLFLSPL
jgi:hypothetical protein